MANLMLKNRMLWLCALLFLLSTSLAAQPKAIGAQVSTEKTAAKKAFALTEIKDLLKGSVTPKRVATLVEQYGVSFGLTDDVEKELRELGADDRLLLVISKNRLQPAPDITPTPQSALTWTDPATGLMWTRQDNGSNVNWNQAKDYCTNMTLFGYSNWRLATIEELAGIYDPTQNVNGRSIKGGIELGGGAWSSSAGKSSGEALIFGFGDGKLYSDHLDDSYFKRALCVRVHSASDITPQPQSAQPTPPAPQIMPAPQSAPTWRQEQIDNYCADNPGSWIAFDNHRFDCLTPPNPPNLKWAKWELNAWHRTYKNQEKMKSSRLSVDQMHSNWDYWKGVYCSLAESGATYKDLNGKNQRCY
jgi:hypothetical protein